MDYIEEGIKNGSIKICPHCSILGELASGCNYIKCPICNGEWCWLCNKPKYKPLEGKEDNECCNDKNHNSH